MVRSYWKSIEKLCFCFIGKSPFLDKYIHRNQWYDVVFAPDEVLDPQVISILGVMLLALARYFRVAMKDILPGGKLYSLSSDEVKGVPTHNKFVERMFGYWKLLMRYMPNASHLTCETFTLYSTNNTAAYLAAKTDEERRLIVAQARKDVPGIRKLYKERQADIQRVRRENLEAERKEKARKEQQRAAELERLVKAVELLGGQWRSEEAVEAGLERLTTGKRGENKVKLDAIKTQINFRKKVLNQNIPAMYGSFSQAGKQFSLQEMTERLKAIVSS